MNLEHVISFVLDNLQLSFFAIICLFIGGVFLLWGPPAGAEKSLLRKVFGWLLFILPVIGFGVIFVSVLGVGF